MIIRGWQLLAVCCICLAIGITVALSAANMPTPSLSGSGAVEALSEQYSLRTGRLSQRSECIFGSLNDLISTEYTKLQHSQRMQPERYVGLPLTLERYPILNFPSGKDVCLVAYLYDGAVVSAHIESSDGKLYSLDGRLWA